jgi:hypothetical protein
LTELDPRRLRAGEVIAGASAAVLLIFMFAVPWYAVSGPLSETLARGLHEPTTFDGWNGLAHLRYLLLVTIVAALALTRAPPFPSRSA